MTSQVLQPKSVNKWYKGTTRLAVYIVLIEIGHIASFWFLWNNGTHFFKNIWSSGGICTHNQEFTESRVCSHTTRPGFPNKLYLLFCLIIFLFWAKSLVLFNSTSFWEKYFLFLESLPSRVTPMGETLVKFALQSNHLTFLKKNHSKPTLFLFICILFTWQI